MPKLSPEKKAQLRKEVLNELDKNTSLLGLSAVKNKTKKKPIRFASADWRTADKKPEPIKPLVDKFRRFQEGIEPRRRDLFSSYLFSQRLIGYWGRVGDKLKIKIANHNLVALKAKTGKEKIIFIIVAILILTAFILIIDIWGMYQKNWHDGFSLSIAKIFRLPAGSVNNKKIELADYLNDLKILNTALTKGREGIDGRLATADELSARIFNRLVTIALINEELNRYQATLSNEDLNQEIQKIIDQFDDINQTKEAIKNLYNLNLNQFKNNVLRPLLAKDKLQEIITQDESLTINQTAKSKTEEALKLAKEPGVDFAVLASQYTEDEAGINTGGDLGWVSPGELAPELEEVLFTLPNNTVYDQIIKNKSGYHLIKVEQKLTNLDDGRISIKARQILIKVDVDQYLKELLTKTKIKKYVK